MEEIKTKVCTKCGRELPIEKFSKGSNKGGLQSRCKDCVSEYMKEYAEKKKRKRKENERVEFEKKYKIYTNKELAKFTPRELMLELKARGYEGILTYKEVIINEHRINLATFE